MTRVEDYHLIRLLQHQPEVYEAEGWREKLGTPAKDTGYRYTVEQLQVWPVPDLAVLWGYANSVRGRTVAFLNALTSEKLAEAYHPERSSETFGIMLARIMTHTALHVGQIDYLRGLRRKMEK